MKKITRFSLVTAFLAASVVGTGFSGCDPNVLPSDTNPQGVVLRAGMALRDGDLSALKRTLSGEAMAKWGDPRGFQLAQAELETVTDLSLSKPVELERIQVTPEAAEDNGSRPHPVVVTTYSIDVQGWDPFGEDTIQVFKLIVQCRDARWNACLQRGSCITVGEQRCRIHDAE